MTAVEPPLALLAELTHRCPLRCPYCSNPLELSRASAELDTESWKRVLGEAAALGVLQVHFSGGEPLVRRDLAELVRHAAEVGLYSNLITSGIGLDAGGRRSCSRRGSTTFSSVSRTPTRSPATSWPARRGAERKAAAARRVREAGLPLTVNFVVHRQNVDRVGAIIALAEAWAPNGSKSPMCNITAGPAQPGGVVSESRSAGPATTAVEPALGLAGDPTIDDAVPDYYDLAQGVTWAAGATVSSTSPRRARPCPATRRDLTEFNFPRNRS